MPLDTDDGAACRTLHRLGNVIQIPPHHDKVDTGNPDGLVVQTVHPEIGLSADLGRKGIRLQPHLLGRKQPRPVIGSSAKWAYVLMELTAQHDVDQLRTPR